MNLYTYRTEVEGKELVLLSFIGADSGVSFNNKTIIGYLKDAAGAVTHENIIYNPGFVEHFHKTVRFFSCFSDAVILMAEQKQNGFVYIVDQRGGEGEEPDPVDIIGSFEVQHGALLNDSYEANPRYRMISEKGLFVLPEGLEALLYATIVE